MRDELSRRRRVGSCILSALALATLLGLSTTTFSQVSSPVELLPAISAQLQNQIASGSIEAKRTALFEIRNLRSPAASRLALPALLDKDPIIRSTAAASVIFLPKNEASSSLLPLLNDKLEFVRREAAYALGDVQDTVATAPLIRLMQRDQILEVRTAAAIALGKIGDMSAVTSLLDILKSRVRQEDEFLRRSAARSIGQIAQINITGNASVLTPQNFLPDKFKDLGTSDATGSRASVLLTATDVLTTVLRNNKESDDTRREAAFAIGAIGDSRSIPVLQAHINAPDPYLAEISREALLKIERRNNLTAPGTK